jgi:hypothetical protein
MPATKNKVAAKKATTSTRKSTKKTVTQKNQEKFSFESLLVNCVKKDWEVYGFQSVDFIVGNLNLYNMLIEENPKRFNWNRRSTKITDCLYWTSLKVENREGDRKIYRFYILQDNHPLLQEVAANCKPPVTQEQLEEPLHCVFGCFDKDSNQLP